MKPLNLNYDSSREQFDAAAEMAMTAGQVVITSPDKNIDKTQYTVTAKFVDGRWQVEDNEPLHISKTVREANAKASQPDFNYNAKNVIRKVILDVVEYATSEEDIVVSVEDDNNEESNKENAIDVNNKLQIMKEGYADYLRNGKDYNSNLREYVEAKADSDPSFFRWLFNNDNLDDFADLTDEQKEEYDDFLDVCEENSFTYDVYFDDDNNTNGEGWHESYQYCKDYIESNNGSNWSYFEDYKGGIVSIYCNETGEEVYSERVK